MRRKGEQKLKRHWPEWGATHPVHNAIKRGSHWFNAWYAQACTPWPVIERKAGIPVARLVAIEGGSEPSTTEIEALAALWSCPVEHIQASIRD